MAKSYCLFEILLVPVLFNRKAKIEILEKLNVIGLSLSI